MLDEGDQIGSYTIEALLGRGGTSRVYRARHQMLGTTHALKVLHTGHERDPVARDRFLKEGQVLARLRHPALVHVSDVVYDKGVAALVMDHLEGRDLSELIADKRIDPQSAADILLQVLSGMAHAHRARVFHRDLKPANLFLEDPSPGHVPFVKVLDFGIAKVADSFVTRAAHTLGTIPYMSPEQIDHPGEVDARSDVFSLGSVLFEMVSRVRPFQGDSDYETQRRIKAGERPEVPDEAGPLAPAIERALQTDPDDRFPSAEAFADALRPHASAAVRERVDSWVGSGSLVGDLDGARDALVEGAGAQPASLGPEPATIRRLGMLQLGSGLLNLTVLGALQCVGTAAFPGSACFASIIVAVGLVEVAAGLRAIATRDATWLRPAAWLEVFSILGLGVVSSVVGAVVLLASRRRAIPERATEGELS
ncbi:MAG: serine/threonine-protein kinase [Myxococcota bacterium]